jgi:hypothetical protein
VRNFISGIDACREVISRNFLSLLISALPASLSSLSQPVCHWRGLLHFPSVYFPRFGPIGRDKNDLALSAFLGWPGRHVTTRCYYFYPNKLRARACNWYVSSRRTAKEGGASFISWQGQKLPLLHINYKQLERESCRTQHPLAAPCAPSGVFRVPPRRTQDQLLIIIMPRRNKTNNQKGISVNPIKRGDKLGRAPLVAVWCSWSTPEMRNFTPPPLKMKEKNTIRSG